VTTGNLLVADKGAITASTIGSGAGGKITIASDTVSLAGGATISAKSSGTGNAGEHHHRGDGVAGREQQRRDPHLFHRGTETPDPGHHAGEIRIKGIRDRRRPVEQPAGIHGFSSATNAGLGGELRVTTGNLLVADKGP